MHGLDRRFYVAADTRAMTAVVPPVKNRLDVEAILFEDASVLGHLRRQGIAADGAIADADFRRLGQRWLRHGHDKYRRG